MADFPVEQHLRNHADDAAAGGQRRIGERTHQADPPAAVDEREPSLRDQRAGTQRQRRVCRAALPGLEPQNTHSDCMERILRGAQ